MNRREFFIKSVLGLASLGFLFGFKQSNTKDQKVSTWDMETDVLVVGSGTGLIGAIRALSQGKDVIVIEKASSPGGNTAISGGVAWIPNNPVMKREGYKDSKLKTLKYLNQLSQGQSTDELIEAFANEGPRMVNFLEENSSLKWRVSKIMGEAGEYHTDWEGSVKKGRSIEPDVSGVEPGVLLGGHLISYLLQSFYKLGGKLITNCPATRLISRELEDGSREILGVSCLRNNKEILIKARKGVLLSCGGFDHNLEMKKQFLRGPSPYSLGVKTNTGDGILMAMQVGADLKNMNEVWGTTVYKDEAELALQNNTAISLNSVTEKKYYPSCILVNKHGKRFSNEKADYDSSWRSFHDKENWGSLEYTNIPAYQIYDQKVREQGTLAGKTVNQKIPGWFSQSPTIEGLARKLKIDPRALKQTVDEYNKFAKKGEDLHFQRGKTSYDRMGMDDVKFAMQPLDKPPFYGAEAAPGDLGTCGGCKVNKSAQVIDALNRPIKRLCASGNNSGVGSPGTSYGGGGGTIGPALTFAFIAGKTLSSLESWS